MSSSSSEAKSPVNNANNSDDDSDIDEEGFSSASEEPVSPTASAAASGGGKKEKQGFGLRAKKFWATATADSAMGRKIIAMFLGEEGNHMLKTIKSAAKKHFNPSKAKDLKANILKLAIKTHLLQQERLITKRDVWMLSDPINNLALAIFNALRPQPKHRRALSDGQDQDPDERDDTFPSSASFSSKFAQSFTLKAAPSPSNTSSTSSLAVASVVSSSPINAANRSSASASAASSSSTSSSSSSSSGASCSSPNGVIDPSPLVSEFAKVRDLCMGLVRPHMTEKNLSKMKDTFDMLGSHAFLHSLLNHPDFAEEKYICYVAIREIVSPLLSSRRYDDSTSNFQQLCITPGCNAYAAEGTGLDGFRGSTMCLIHHEEALNSLMAKPSLMHFLTGDGKEYFPFQADLKKDVARYMRKLWINLNRFKHIPIGAKPIFVEEVYKKYIKKGASHRVMMDDKLIENLEKNIGLKGDDLFDPIMQDLYKRMDDYFTNVWVKSPAMKQYLASYQLPLYLQKELARIKAKRKAFKKET